MHHSNIFDCANDIDGRMLKVFRLLQDKVGFLPPTQFFQRFAEGPYTLAGRILGQCARLAKKEGELDSFYPWMEEMIGLVSDDRAMVIFGKAVYGRGTDEPSDVDALFLIDENDVKERDNIIRMHRMIDRAVVPGSAVHGQLIPRNHDGYGIGGWTTLCIANGLVLFPRRPSDTVLNSIYKARDEFEGRPFFGKTDMELGGIGELITYAMTKILEGREGKYLTEEELPILDKFAEKIEFFDPKHGPSIELHQKKFCKTDMGGELLSPSQYNMEARERIRDTFDDGEIAVIAKAAMRRIRVRKERADELASRVVKEFPKKGRFYSY